MATTKNPMAVGDGNLNSFPFTFPYLKTKDIKVELFHSTGGRKELDSTKFSMANATTISLSAIDSATDWQMASGAPKQGITGNIYRETSSDQLLATFYPGSAIRSEDLNNNYTQNLYATKESSEDATDALDNSRVLVNGVYKSAIDRATEAETTADLADGKADTAIDTADDAKDATDALVGVYNTTTNQWETRGHDDSANGDPESGVGKALDDALEAKNIAIAADDIADDALEATDALVGKKDAYGIWYARGHGAGEQDSQGDDSFEDGVGKALADSANAVSTADTAQNTYAIPAKTAADTAQLATDSLVGTTTDNGTTWTLQGDGQNNNKGVKYAVEKVDDWIVNGDGLGTNEEGVPYAVQQSTDAVLDATAALNNSRRSDGANPCLLYTSDAADE